MKVAVEQLTWHDGSVDSVHYDESARRLMWQVEVFRWDIDDMGDAVPGEVVFEGVERVEALHALVDEVSPDSSWGWSILDAFFERGEGELRCRFLLEVPDRVNERGGPGYGEVIVICQDAWYTPTREDTP